MQDESVKKNIDYAALVYRCNECLKENRDEPLEIHMDEALGRLLSCRFEHWYSQVNGHLPILLDGDKPNG